MRSKLVRASLLASLVALFFAILTTGSALAAPAAQPSSTTVTTSGVDSIPVSADQCAKLKVALPAQASDPRLCTIVHHWTSTTTIQHGRLSTSSCITGTRSFHDWIGDFTHFWQMDLDTAFQWTGNCGAPNLTRQSCYIEWETDTTITQESCYNYIYNGSGWQSRAAVYTGWVTTTVGGQWVSSWNSQRRECYSDNINRCQWTGWVGK